MSARWIWFAAAILACALGAWTLLAPDGQPPRAVDRSPLGRSQFADGSGTSQTMDLQARPLAPEAVPLDASALDGASRVASSTLATQATRAISGQAEVSERPLREVVLRVVDRAGEPVREALVAARGAEDTSFPGRVRVAAGGDGVAHVDLTRDWDEWLLVTAPGFGPAWVVAHSQDVGVLTVVLDRAASLVVRVVTADGLPLEEFSVHVSAHGPVREFIAGSAADNSSPPAAQTQQDVGAIVARMAQASVPQARHDVPYGESLRFVPDEDGTLRVHDVAARALRVELRDRWEQPLDVVEDVVVPRGEQREVELVASGDGRDLVVDVRDPEGRPAEGVRVWLRTTDGGTFGGRTERDGRHVFRRLAAERVSFGVDDRGYLPYHSDEVFVDAGTVTILLERAETLNVELVDVHGGSVPAESLRAEWSSGGVEVTERPTATSCSVDGYACTFERLPAHEVRLAAQVGGRRFERTHDTRLGALRWELPCHGELVLVPPDPLPEGALVRIDLDELDASGEVIDHVARSLHAERDGAPFVLPAVRAGRYRARLLRFDRELADFAPASVWAPADVSAHGHDLVSLERLPGAEVSSPDRWR